MTAVLMAGGLGTRVASVDSSVPKPLLPVAGKPVLTHQIECLRGQGITEIVLVVGHLGRQIVDYYGDGHSLGVQITYIVEETPLGTAGALFYLKDRLKEDFLLLNGDLIFDVDFSRLLAFHREKGALATILVHPNDHPYDSGLIDAEEDGRVRAWLSAGEREWVTNLVNAGIHVLSPKLLEGLTEVRKRNLDRELLKPLIGQGGLWAYRSPEYVKDMGTPERIRQVEKDLETGLVRSRNLHRKQRAVFLDRDGTLNRYVGFLRSPEQLELLPGAAEAVR